MAENQRSRLRWLCRRGTREMDLLLQRFMDEQYDHLHETERQALGELLECPDQDLYAWISGSRQPPDSVPVALIKKIQLCLCLEPPSIPRPCKALRSPQPPEAAATPPQRR